MGNFRVFSLFGRPVQLCRGDDPLDGTGWALPGDRAVEGGVEMYSLPGRRAGRMEIRALVERP